MTTYSTRQRYFRFEILNTNQEATGEDAGFIDPLKPQDYVDFDGRAGTLDNYEAKARGYLRWINLSLALSKFGVNYLQINKVEGADAITVPSKLIFTMGFDNAEYMYYKNSEGKEYTSNVEDANNQVPTNENARAYVLKMITADFMINNYMGIIDVWNPELDSLGRNPSDAPIGMITPQLKANKLLETPEQASSCISINEIDSPEYEEVES